MTAATITSITCHPMRLPFDHGAPPPLFAGKPRTTIDSALVRVELACGSVGWGESYAPELTAIQAFFETRVAPLAVGKDATDSRLVPTLERVLHNMGRSGLMLHALSGLDIALHDLRAQLEGVPLYVLLGGARRTRIPAYASLLQYYGDGDLIRRNVARALEAGYGEVKLHEPSAAAVAAARAEMDASTPLMLDTNCAWTLPEAFTALQELDGSDLTWVEEPLWPPEDLDALAQLRAASRLPLAVGENAASLFELATLARTGAVDYLQPSAIKCGGVSSLMALAALCADGPTVFAPQSAFFGPGFLATLHVLAAQPREVAIERLFCDLEVTPYAHSHPFQNGGFELTDCPGLGATPQPELLASR